MILIELVVFAKSDLKLRRYGLCASFLRKLLTLDVTESRWRTIPLVSQEKIPRDAREKCERRKMKSVSRSTRRSNDERSFSRSRTQSLDTFPPVKRSMIRPVIGDFAPRYSIMLSCGSFSAIPAKDEDVPSDNRRSYTLSFVLVKNLYSRATRTRTV